MISAPVENLFTPNCIRTVSGIYMNVFEPTPEMIRIEDIAHALSHQCRFGGHLSEFYTVAQHSVFCAELASPQNKLAALLHDASEAYLLDIPSPIKVRLANYKEIEHKLMLAIADKFDFQYPLPAEVKEIDAQALQFEWDAIMLKDRLAPKLTVYSIQEARAKFLAAFESCKAPVYGK